MYTTIKIYVCSMIIKQLGNFGRGMLTGSLVKHVNHTWCDDRTGLIINPGCEYHVHLENFLIRIVEVHDLDTIGKRDLLMFPQWGAGNFCNRGFYISIHKSSHYLSLRYHKVEQFFAENNSRAVCFIESRDTSAYRVLSELIRLTSPR